MFVKDLSLLWTSASENVRLDLEELREDTFFYICSSTPRSDSQCLWVDIVSELNLK